MLRRPEPPKERVESTTLRVTAIAESLQERWKVYFTTLLWQNNGRQNGLLTRMLFSELYKIMVNKLPSVGFGGDRSPQFPSWIRRWQNGWLVDLAILIYLISLRYNGNKRRGPGGSGLHLLETASSWLRINFKSSFTSSIFVCLNLRLVA